MSTQQPTTRKRISSVIAGLALLVATALCLGQAQPALAFATTSIMPYAGPLAGGTPVTISGSGFTGTTNVTIGGAAVTFNVVNDGQITATTPASAVPGPAPVQITNGANIATIYFQYQFSSAATFVVTSSADGPNDSNCQPGACTLRQALYASNNHVNADGSPNRIEFNIAVPASGPVLIQLDPVKSWSNTALGWANAPIVLDGLTQPGAVCDGTTRNIRIEIRPGPGLDASTHGLGLSGPGLADGSTIRGVAIGGFTGAGLEVRSSNNHIECSNFGTDASGMVAVPNGGSGIEIGNGNGTVVGGSAVAQRNILSGNASPGLRIWTSNNQVLGNYVGVNATGAVALPNTNGVTLAGSGTANTVGGSSPGSRNVIAGNSGAGILVLSPGNHIAGNYIGTDPTGLAAIPNTLQGIRIESTAGNVIGGDQPGEGNVISGNANQGVFLLKTSSASVTGTTITGNLIGVGADGMTALGNQTVGIGIADPASSNNQVIANVIANNGGAGVSVNGSPANRITQNSIHSNVGVGILGSPIGAGNFSQFDAGPGNLTTIRLNTGPGAVTGTTPIPFTFELFSSPSCDPSGAGEGKTYITTVNTTANGAVNGGRVVFQGPVDLSSVPTGHVVTATLTNQATGATSGFTQCVIAGLQVASVLPAAQVEANGEVPVLISGTGFDLDGMTMTFAPGGVPVNPPLAVTVHSATSASAILPATMAGFVTVTLNRSQAYGGGSSPAFSFYVWPRLTGISPAAAAAGSGDTPVTIIGNRFAVATPPEGGAPAIAPARVFVNGTLVTTQPGNSATEVVATIPASMLETVGTLQITVRNPANPFASSNILPFFVTQASVQVLDADAATASFAEEVTVSASTQTGETIQAVTNVGTGTVAVANYGAAPAETGTSFQTANGYFDVYVAPGSTFTSTTVTYCDPLGGEALYWSPTDAGGFVVVPNVSILSEGPEGTCLQFTVGNDPDIHPNIFDLAGTAFAVTPGYTPVIESLAVSPSLTPVRTAVSVDATFSDVDLPEDFHKWSIDWGDGTVTEGDVADGATSVSNSHAYSEASVYRVTLRVIDKDGAYDEEQYLYIIVYDPSAGFVTGGGWFTSPVGAYTADATITGKATFGFVSQYKKGANVPTGNTEFQFNAAGLNFKSTSYDWLVVAGSKAQYKGTGTINGQGSYRFMLTAIDGGNGGVDKFRIRIWDAVNGGLVYDNQVSSPDDADPTTAIGGGSIVVHK